MTSALLIPIVVMMLLLVLALALLVLKATRTGQHADEYPYQRAGVLFSAAERSFLGVLEQATAGQYRVFGKVRMADVVKVRPIQNRSLRQRAFNRITGKHFDFVLCTPDELLPVAVIELDDRSHEREDRQQRDRLALGVCEAAGLPLLQFPARHAYSLAELRNRLKAAIDPPEQSGSPPRANEPRSAAPTATSASTPPSPSAPRTIETNAAVPPSAGPTCPKCSAPMIVRKARAGANAGHRFWACTTYPKCRGAIHIGL